MGIVFNDTAKTIALHTKNSSYQMKVGTLDYLLHLYYGPVFPWSCGRSGILSIPCLMAKTI